MNFNHKVKVTMHTPRLVERYETVFSEFFDEDGEVITKMYDSLDKLFKERPDIKELLGKGVKCVSKLD